jgi:hypothetical protein
VHCMNIQQMLLLQAVWIPVKSGSDPRGTLNTDSVRVTVNFWSFVLMLLLNVEASLHYSVFLFPF